ncbi:NUDIX domain-containing protein [Kitasatospora sp. MAP5-34]|uniref:NUDIX domain-containing protein n=1 Tax=Kitasatospora sp. MAP5-34 TaxID=3035102 RepID=UPI002475DE60|nr:NUDIX domain-containing protein [Kitasatospora sp. MAP5-34]MDH6578551.1 ADP-ribose pyrophosphatase YjhB (NUDIX family) [Kitasatospora sp. MAP5-34]
MESTLHPDPLMAAPPARRIECVVIAFNSEGHVLMVDPEHQEGLVLPGGAAGEDEAAHDAAARHLLAQTTLVLDLWQLLAVDHLPAGEHPEGYNFVFNGGVLTAKQVERINTDTPGTRLRGHRFVGTTELPDHVSPVGRRRIAAAWLTRRDGQGIPLLVRGFPVG